MWCVERTAEAEIDPVKGSRFIGLAAPVPTRDAALGWVEDVPRAHRKATHVVWAHRHGPDDGLCSDDGEPSGTSGPPVLARIDGLGLSRCAVAVVRYYGGVKLGKGGLIRAYGAAAGAVLEVAGRVEVQERVRLRLRVDLARGAAVERVVRTSGFAVERIVWTDAVDLVCVGPARDVDALTASVTEAARGAVTVAVDPG